ncbi:MAG: VOC family protein [Candidatus Binatia bacterium]|jgi:methylmalonyl-CoA/ethylmalonyl-CoA epimerase
MIKGADMRVDHVSVAVNEIDTALAFFRRVFPLEMRVEKRRGFSDDFKWCDFYIGQFKLELIEPTCADSFVRRFIDKRGEGLHHMSLEVTQLQPLLERLEADGIRIVDRSTAGDGDMTAFISPRSAHGVLVQFWQTPQITEPERPRTAPLRLRSGAVVNMRVDHVAIAVRHIDTAMNFFRRYFPVRSGRAPHPGYDGTFFFSNFLLNGYKIELLAEQPDQPPGFVSRFLKRHGEGLHHISVDVDRLDPLLAQLEADGVRIVDRTDFSDEIKTAFISPRSAHGVLIQFWQTPFHAE